MDRVESWASREANERGVTSPHKIAGFKEGVRAAYEAMQRAKQNKRLSFVPGGDLQDIWEEFVRG